MTKSSIGTTRRAFLAALSLVPLGACATLVPEPALARRRFRAVRIDVSPMIAKGVPNWAARVAAALAPHVHSAFADLVDAHDRKAPVLTLRIDAANFSIYTGGLNLDPLGAYGTDTESDWIDGWVIAGSDRRHVTATSAASVAGPWYLPDIDQRRLDRVAAIFAQWARKEFD